MSPRHSGGGKALGDRRGRPTKSVSRTKSARHSTSLNQTKEVTRTRSRLEGKRGSLRWAIHVDAPGGHGDKLNIVKGLEFREVDLGLEGNHTTENRSDRKTKSRKRRPTSPRKRMTRGNSSAASIPDIPEQYLRTPCDLDAPATPDQREMQPIVGEVPTSLTQHDSLLDSAYLPEMSIDGSEMECMFLDTVSEGTSSSSSFELKKKSKRNTTRPSSPSVNGRVSKQVDKIMDEYECCGSSSNKKLATHTTPAEAGPQDAGFELPMPVPLTTSDDNVDCSEVSLTPDAIFDVNMSIATSPQYIQQARNAHVTPNQNSTSNTQRTSTEGLGDEFKSKRSRTRRKTVSSRGPKDESATQKAVGRSRSEGQGALLARMHLSMPDVHELDQTQEFMTSHSTNPPATKVALETSFNNSVSQSVSSSETSSVWLSTHHKSFVAKHTLKNPYQVPDLIMDGSVPSQFMQLTLDDGSDVQEVDDDEIQITSRQEAGLSRSGGQASLLASMHLSMPDVLDLGRMEKFQISHSHSAKPSAARAALETSFNNSVSQSVSSSETSSVWLSKHHKSFVAKHTLKNPYQVPDLIMDRSTSAQFMQLNLDDGAGAHEVDNDEVESASMDETEDQEQRTNQGEVSKGDARPIIPKRQNSSDLNNPPTGSEEPSSKLVNRRSIAKLLRSKSSLGLKPRAPKTPKGTKRNVSMDRSSSKFKQFLAFANASFSSHGGDGELLDDDDEESLS